MAIPSSHADIPHLPQDLEQAYVAMTDASAQTLKASSALVKLVYSLSVTTDTAGTVILKTGADILASFKMAASTTINIVSGGHLPVFIASASAALTIEHSSGSHLSNCSVTLLEVV